ncbi:hypothetical protein ACGFWF_09155 [Streptomyces sp. NPDC048581]|uniref:hypothetical protein n=1 Tax=Streptomyces sp. NPDC048581 TaxID=3365572 RepID=UPI00371014DC
MLTHFRLPAHTLRASVNARRPRPLVVVLRAALLAVVGLCALVHGPFGEEGRPASSVSATSTTASVTVAGSAVPHGPHPHHGNEKCTPAAAVRAMVQAAQHPPAGLVAAALAGAPAAALVWPRAFRRPYHFRSRRTGRTVLVRTCRWRI